MDVMFRFAFTVARGTYGVRLRSVVSAGAGMCPLAIQRLGFRWVLVLAEDYTIRVERVSAFITPMIGVAAVEAKSFIQAILLFLWG